MLTRALDITTSVLVFALAIGLAGPAAAETLTWDNLAGGNWNDVLNWNPQDVPNEAGEDALVNNDGGTYTITLDTSPSLDLVTIDNPLATLNLGAQSLVLLLPGGLTNLGTVVANSGAATIRGNIRNQTGGAVHVRSGQSLSLWGPAVTNDGETVLNINVSTANAYLYCRADVELGGAGELVLVSPSDPNDAQIVTDAGMTLTQLAGHTIRGAGEVDARLVNYGLVVADDSVEHLMLQTEPKTNYGTLSALPGAYLYILCDILQDAGGQILADGGIVRLRSGSSVTGGTLASAGGGFVECSTEPVTLADLTNASRYEIRTGQTTVLLGSTIVNEGEIALNPELGSLNAVLRADASVTLSGVGLCEMFQAGNENDATISTSAGVVLTNALTHTIRGGGRITGELINDGLVSADQTGYELWLSGSPKTNNATFQAADGGILHVAPTEITQGPAGLILADSATVRFYGGAAITGGTFDTPHGGVIETKTGTITVTDVTNEGRWDLVHDTNTQVSGPALTNNGEITVHESASATNSWVTFLDDVTLQGSGQMRMQVVGGINDALVRTASEATLTQASTHTLRGAGTIDATMINEGAVIADSSDFQLRIGTSEVTNRNLFAASDGALLEIVGSTIVQEGAGRLLADGGTVRIDGSTHVRGGTLETASGGSVRCYNGPAYLDDVTNLGEFGIRTDQTTIVESATLINEGTILLNYDVGSLNSTLRFDTDATLSGSGETVMITNGNTNDAVLSTATDMTVTIGSNQTVRGAGTISARLVNEGQIVADQAINELILTTNPKVNNGVMRAENHGRLAVVSGQLTNATTMLALDSSRVRVTAGTLENEGEIVASGPEAVLENVGSGYLVNRGAIRVNAAGLFEVTAGTFDNFGVTRAEEGGRVRFDYGTFHNFGSIEADSAGLFWSDRMYTHYASGVLTGGTWQVRAGGDMQLVGANVQTLAARAILIGPGATIHSDEGVTDALAGVHTITEGGLLEVQAGRDFATAADLTIERGGLSVGEGCTFTVNGSHTQIGNEEIPNLAGLTCVTGTLIAATDPIDIQGGRLCGNGTIQNSVVSAGRVNPGASAGELTITGDFTQTEDGTCWIELAGLGAGEYDHLQINGDATLAGRLVVTSIEGYEPQVGDRFTILTCATRAGEFTLETGSPGVGLLYETYYYPDHIEIEIFGDPSYVPEPESADDTPGGPSDGTEIGSDETFDTPELTPTSLGLFARPIVGGALLVLDLPRAAEVTLEVFDFGGRRLAVLAEGSQNAGRHSYAWDGVMQGGARAASGVYFGRARVAHGAGEDVRQARLILVR